MNVLLFANDAYYVQLITVLFSLYKNNITDSFTIYLYGLETTRPKLVGYIRRLCKEKMHIVFLDGFPKEFQRHLSIDDKTSIFLNKFIFFVLPSEVERVLYIDCDLVINGSLSEFYNQSFENNSLIVTRDLALDYGPYKMPNGLLNPNYFNAGVLLINLAKIRALYSLNTIEMWLDKYRGRLPNDDQDVLNMLFFNDTKVMPNRSFNYCVRHKDQRIHSEIATACIIHYYYQNNKPWKYSYYNRNGFRIYWKYARHTFGPLVYLRHLFVYRFLVFRFLYLATLHRKMRTLLQRR